MGKLKVYSRVIAAAIIFFIIYTILTARPRVDKSKLVAYIHKNNTPRLVDRTAIYIPPDMKIPLEALSRKSLQDPKSADLSKAVFVTAADYSHFKESKDSIASIQKHLPNHTIIYYDMGLWWSSYVREVRSWCGVAYRQLNFTKYPAHVKTLLIYARKPIIIQEVLHEHDTIIWFDVSIRVKCPNMLNQLEPTIRKSGIATVDPTKHSSFATTYVGMYDFLSVNNSLLIKQQMGSGFIALTNSKQLFEHVIVWWVCCALWKDCIAPSGSSLGCHFTNRYKEYANCHRYDQSALNLLLLDMFNGDVDMYTNKQACISVERNPTSHYQLQYCRK